MNADKREIFGIIEQERLTDSESIVRGRVYSTIKVGDIVCGYPEGESAEEMGFSFVVMEIRFYDKSVPELTEGYTCELTLKGDNMQILSNISSLLTQ